MAKFVFFQLSYLGRDYPLGADWFHSKLKNAFIKTRGVTDPEELSKLLDRGDFVVKEVEALYRLRKYRTLKKRYYSEDTLTPESIQKKIESTIESNTDKTTK